MLRIWSGQRGGERERWKYAYLGEELSPDGLNLELGGRDDGVELVGLYCIQSQWTCSSLYCSVRNVSRKRECVFLLKKTWKGGGCAHTVISIPSSARIRAA
jgi:hypothetical protein